MTLLEQAALKASREGLDEMLAALPPTMPREQLELGMMASLLERHVSTPPTRHELGLVGLLACALARLKELERL